MLAQHDNIFEETCQTIFQKNQDDQVRYWCEALEEGERTVRTIEYNYKRLLDEKDSAIAEKGLCHCRKGLCHCPTKNGK